ncbi:MAG TPA: hypothetical protein VMB79_00470 [Jatrophihabitans sp.]|nr:hypothetical protein [Jatrophihabitans sp.]
MKSLPTARPFDPVAVGRAECDAWAAYYRREWFRFLRAALAMVSAGFGMGRLRTVRGAWYVLQANRAWAPYPDNDPGAARRQMRRFYELVVRSGWGVLEPRRAAELEVEWWRVHRLHQREDGATGEQLVDALDALYSHVYGVPAATMREAARLRAAAMELSDSWVLAGCDRADPLLARQRLTLVASFSTLRAAVDRQATGRQPVDRQPEPSG